MATAQSVIPIIAYHQGETGIDTSAVPAARGLTWLSVLSGLCVGVCFLALRGDWVGTVAHVLIFASTILLALRTGAQLRNWLPQHRLATILDGIALTGLCLIAFFPVAAHAAEMLLGNAIDTRYSVPALIAVSLAFALLAITTYRHLLLYRELGRVCRQNNWRVLGRSCVTLGWAKMFYEGIWLGSCSLAPLIATDIFKPMGIDEDVAIWFAFGAFFGCMGFITVWIGMIVTHARLLVVLQQPTITGGFPVIATGGESSYRSS
ncbi:MAG TPA: hypothetical protein VGB55_11820 [Tepidisphaeraceae bacterium]|jgi:hypothetical protein